MKINKSVFQHVSEMFWKAESSYYLVFSLLRRSRWILRQPHSILRQPHILEYLDNQIQISAASSHSLFYGSGWFFILGKSQARVFVLILIFESIHMCFETAWIENESVGFETTPKKWIHRCEYKELGYLNLMASDPHFGWVCMIVSLAAMAIGFRVIRARRNHK